MLVSMKNAHLLGSEDRPAPGDLRFVQGLLNTLDVDSGRDRLSDTRLAAEWLERFGLIPTVDAVDDDGAARLRSFREAVRSLLSAHEETSTVATAAATLDTLASQVAFRLAFGRDGSVALVTRSTGVDGAIGMLLAALHEAAGNGTLQRLKVCARDSCQWAYYDASKNRSSNWCSMETCGNREKAARHRHKAAATG